MDMDTLIPLITSWGMRIVGAIVFMVVAFWIANRLQSFAKKRMDKAGVDSTLSDFGSSTMRWAILIMSGIAMLGIFGVETTSFAALIGAGGLAVGLAFQGTLSNVAAGVMLMLFRPFTAGDVISVAGQTGKVAAIDLFSTTMDTVDNRRIIVPNGAVFGTTIENITFHDTRRVDVNVGCDYSASIDETRAALVAAAATVDGVLAEPGAVAVLTGLGGSSVDWQLRVWCKTEDYFAVLEAATRAVKIELDAVGIGIPFPQMDVHVDGKLG